MNANVQENPKALFQKPDLDGVIWNLEFGTTLQYGVDSKSLILARLVIDAGGRPQPPRCHSLDRVNAV